MKVLSDSKKCPAHRSLGAATRVLPRGSLGSCFSRTSQETVDSVCLPLCCQRTFSPKMNRLVEEHDASRARPRLWSPTTLGSRCGLPIPELLWGLGLGHL